MPPQPYVFPAQDRSCDLQEHQAQVGSLVEEPCWGHTQAEASSTCCIVLVGGWYSRLEARGRRGRKELFGGGLIATMNCQF